MPAFAAFCAAWSLTIGLACFAAEALPRQWLDRLSTGHYTGLCLLLNALACFLGLLAAQAAA